MELQENLIEFASYNIDFKIQDGWFIIGIQYDNDWTVIEPQNSKIEYLHKDGKHYYGAILDNDSLINETFDLIRLTISYNKDLEKKVDLFQEKVKELQNIFANTDYEDLKNLEFKVKKKRKYVKKFETNENVKNDNEQKIEEEIKEEMNVKDSEINENKSNEEIKIFE